MLIRLVPLLLFQLYYNMQINRENTRDKKGHSLHSSTTILVSTHDGRVGGNKEEIWKNIFKIVLLYRFDEKIVYKRTI